MCKGKNTKTYNSGDSPVVSHLTTNPPISLLSVAEQTGCADLEILWSYVKEFSVCEYFYAQMCTHEWIQLLSRRSEERPTDPDFKDPTFGDCWIARRPARLAWFLKDARRVSPESTLTE
jgi:hypothetical protein